MKRTALPLLLLAFSFASEASASPDSDRFVIGADLSLPYLLRVDGASAKTRGNFQPGVDGRFFLDEHLALGARFGIDAQKRRGSERQISFTPGIRYQWMSAQRFSPFLRFDLPVVLRGAFHGNGSSGTRDLGVSFGGGLVWNLGGALGIPGAALRYDFDFQHLFGIGDAASVWAMEFFKFGVEYRF